MTGKKTVQKAHRPQFALFGGSFDPIHQGHVDVIEGVLATGRIDHLLVVPAERSPFKNGTTPLPAEVRYHMVRQALQGMSRVSVTDVELRRPPPSYTLDTLMACEALFPRAQWWLVMGWDAFQGFARWHRAAEIVGRAGLMLVDRPGTPAVLPDTPEQWIQALPGEWRTSVQTGAAGQLVTSTGRVVVERIEMKTRDISSSRIRDGAGEAAIPQGALKILEAYRERTPQQSQHHPGSASSGKPEAK